MELITLDQAREALTEIVNANPDKVYARRLRWDSVPQATAPFSARCFYSTKDGEPDCGVGHVIHKLAPELFAEIVEYEKTNDQSAAVDEMVNGSTTPCVPLTYDARKYLQKFQSQQDAENPWSVSLERTEKYAESYL